MMTTDDATRKKGFDVTAWEAQWNDLRREHDALADKVFSGTSKEEAA